MTRRPWTNTPQEAWLRNQLDEFLLAEANDVRKDFYKRMYQDWLKSWPNPEPTADEIVSAGTFEQAESRIYGAKFEVSQCRFGGDIVLT